jgi:hypothetical protein
MRYRSFGDRSATISALTLRLDDTRRKGSVNDWRDFVFAALEAGVNAFEIGQSSPNMLNGAAEAFASMERRLFMVSWRTSLSGGAIETFNRTRELAGSLGLAHLDLLILELEAPLRDPGVLADLRESGIARWLAVTAPASILDESIISGQFDGIALPLDPEGGWNERNRIRAASNRGMGVIALSVSLDVGGSAEDAPKGGLLRLFTGRSSSKPAPAFRIDVPGWSEQQVAIAHALTDPCISSVVVQTNCIPTLEGLAWSVERDLPAGAQAQIEMARFSNVVEGPVERRSKRRA